MYIPRLYIDMPLAQGEEIGLPQAQTHHIQHVLRMRLNEKLILFNHSDSEYDCHIQHIDRKALVVKVNDSRQVNVDSPLQLHLLLGIMLGQQMDYAIQKAVELSVSRIVPIVTEYSHIKHKPQILEKKTRHWQGIIVNAAEQCGRTRIAELSSALSFEDSLSSELPDARLLLHPLEAKPFSDNLFADASTLCLLIGPEGGFSDAERKNAINRGFQPVSLGPRILRADTAVVAAMTACQLHWGDFSVPRIE